MGKIQKIFQLFAKEYLLKYKPNMEQMKTIDCIIKCKTGKLGSHIELCSVCNKMIYTYNACKNRNCPNCQNYKKERWKEQRINDALDVKYFHIVFTLPSKLHGIFMQNKKILYDTLLSCSSETILELAKKNYGFTPGIMSMLHTWNQIMDYFPHVHLIVTAGGVTNNEWINCNNNYYFDIEELQNTFKNKLLRRIKIII